MVGERQERRQGQNLGAKEACAQLLGLSSGNAPCEARQQSGMTVPGSLTIFQTGKNVLNVTFQNRCLASCNLASDALTSTGFSTGVFWLRISRQSHAQPHR